MLGEKEKEDLLHKLNTLKGEIGHIKDRLNKINNEKELYFSQKEEYHRQILDKVASLKGEKSKRNELTSQVKDLKAKRDVLNAKIKAGLEELKVLEEGFKGEKSKAGIQENPVEIKKKIERLEFRIETEPMSFDREKELMKEIKKLKKSYDSMKDVKVHYDTIEAKRKEIRDLRKEATTYHKQVQESASKSQDHHEVLLGSSDEINAFKTKEEEAYKKFIDMKQEFTNVNNELKTKLMRLKEVKDLLEEAHIELEEETKANIRKALEEKEKEVEEKVKKTRKLTTEDLLVLQAKEEAEEQREKRMRRRHGKNEHHEERKEEIKEEKQEAKETKEEDEKAGRKDEAKEEVRSP